MIIWLLTTIGFYNIIMIAQDNFLCRLDEKIIGLSLEFSKYLRQAVDALLFYDLWSWLIVHWI